MSLHLGVVVACFAAVVVTVFRFVDVVRVAGIAVLMLIRHADFVALVVAAGVGQLAIVDAVVVTLFHVSGLLLVVSARCIPSAYSCPMCMQPALLPFPV